MDRQTAQEILGLATSLVSIVAPGGTGSTISVLEQIAMSVGKAYQAEAGQPIDPAKFTFEAPLESTGPDAPSAAAVAPTVAGDADAQSTTGVLD